MARKSQDLYHHLSININRQLKLKLNETIHPLIDWANQAKLDCEKLENIP